MATDASTALCGFSRYITDWYPTFCALAGVDATDNWTDPTTAKTHSIDGVNLWPFLVAGDDGGVVRISLEKVSSVLG